ncbi:ubiquitin-conjugating enzyme [Stagonosporopsis vannaccii]|nr:ubiquitin-conjugating enzyme [Stagonosporopsis vannaccii]
MSAPPAASTPRLSSFRKQHLLIEFSTLRHAQLDGVFVSITPGDPSLWVGVMFVRKGSPYAPAVLRFQISFPSSYPALPPLVTLSTDVFHPLLTPLTTYTHTTATLDTDTVSATDEERLPPGGFSLRHGFPHWFGRARRSVVSSYGLSGSDVDSTVQTVTPVHPAEETGASGGPGILPTATGVSIVTVLEYIRSTFSEETVLDSVSLEAAANPGAYHAWRAYRGPTISSQQPASPNSVTSGDGKALGRNRRPGEWNWEGVWEERVRRAVSASLSESVLYGQGAGEDIIRFQQAGDDETMARMKERLDVAIARTAEA